MRVSATVREVGGEWVGECTAPSTVRVRAASAEECVEALRSGLRDALGVGPDGEPLELVVGVEPALAGVAEAAAMLGWDKRRVATYVKRGRFPEPVQALASGRIWRRDDVERFAEDFRAAQRKRRAARAAATATARPSDAS